MKGRTAVSVRRLTCGGLAVLTLLGVACRSAPRTVPSTERELREQHGCFAHAVPDRRHLESSRLEGAVFTAGYSPAEFPIPVAVVYVRRSPDGKVMSADADQNGRFVIPDAPDGVYELGVCANGWNPWRGTVRVRRDGPTVILALPLELGM